MNYAKRTDGNHCLIMESFRRLGCSVVDLSRVGAGVPDLAVSLHKFTAYVEIKTETGTLEPSQIRFHRESKATIYVARTLKDVAEIVAHMKRLAFARTPE